MDLYRDDATASKTIHIVDIQKVRHDAFKPMYPLPSLLASRFFSRLWTVH